MDKTQDALQTLIRRVDALERQVREQKGKDGGGYWMEMSPYNFIPGTDLTTSGQPPYLHTIPRDLILRKIVFTSFTRTTNNSGNHWSIELLNFSATVTFLAAQSLEADTADTWTVHEYTTFAVPGAVLSTDKQLRFRILKTGAPGALLVGGPCLFFI